MFEALFAVVVITILVMIPAAIVARVTLGD
jgi:hypothetical protein